MTAPINLTVTPINSGVVLTWEKPVLPDNQKVLDYDYQLDDGTAVWNSMNTVANRHHLISSLPPQIEQTIRIRAYISNEVGGYAGDSTAWVSFTPTGRTTRRLGSKTTSRTLDYKAIVNNLEPREAAYPVYRFGPNPKNWKYERPSHNPFKGLDLSEFEDDDE